MRRSVDCYSGSVALATQAVIWPVPADHMGLLRQEAATAGAAASPREGVLVVTVRHGTLAAPGAGALAAALARPPFAGLCAKLRLVVSRSDQDLGREDEPQAILTLFGVLGACLSNPNRASRSAVGPDARNEEESYPLWYSDDE